MTCVTRIWAALLSTAVLIAAAACSGGGDSGSISAPGGDFVSDNPDLGGAAGPVPGGDHAGTGGTTGAGGTGGSGGGSAGSGQDDPGRIIEEADVIQMSADRLFALSRYGGLSVIDAAQPDQLRLLGRWKAAQATPFEMYVRDNVVIGLFTGWGEYVGTAGSWQWIQTSNIIALDVADTANIRVIGNFRVAGAISDSRIVGNVLYVVSYEDGYCYECTQGARTVIVSLDVTNPQSIRRVDTLSYVDGEGYGGWGPRSVTATTDRMYVAGPEYDITGQDSSSIQVVDISDPAGDLVPGASVRAEGQIRSRWQMDEHDGVLRVVSQSSTWGAAPIIQTFTVASSQSVTPLGRAELILPRPEQLQSVRFDGARAYAITFERTDPLFTIDLSNPALPRQAGELEIPGWVYHMVPRGDRLIGVGFDQGNVEGSLHVSLFDVTNLTAPTMIKRVNFGPTGWGSLGEDQNRIHKAFRILDEHGLILVPYSGYSYNEIGGYDCGSSYSSAVQLIDLAGDDLSLRGAAPSFGDARRALIHRDRLLTVSDDRVQTFNITNRDAPTSTSSLALARNVANAVTVGNHAVRLTRNWWTDTVEIDVAPLSNASAAQGLGSIDLQTELGEPCWSNFYGARMFADPGRVYVAYEGYGYWHYEGSGRQAAAVAVIDVTDPAAPKLESHHELGFTGAYYYGGYGYDQVISSGERVVKVGQAIAFLRVETTWQEQYPYGEDVSKAWLEIVDLRDSKAPRTSRLDLQANSGLTGMHVDGTSILTSHFEPLTNDPTRGRFYITRIDLTNPSAPRIASKVNVPGSLYAWHSASGRAITIDYQRHVERNVNYDTCYQRHGYNYVYWQPQNVDPRYGYYDQSTLGDCHWVTHSFKLVSVDSNGAVLEDSHAIPSEWMLGAAAVGDARVFVSVAPSYYYGYDCYYGGVCDGQRAPPAPLLVLSGFETGQLGLSELGLSTDTPYGYNYISRLVASGTRAVASVGYEGGVAVIDAADASAPRIAATIDFPGNVEDITISGDTALVTLGYDGIQTLNLTAP